MRRALFTLVCVIACVASASAQERRLLYMTTPDGAQPGGSGAGVMIFDMDKGHAFVRRIEVPTFKEGVRGVNACAATGRLYVTTSGHRLVCIDLKTDAVLWQKTYDTGCDRGAITPDGKVLYVPSGYWSHDACWMVVSGETGEEVAPRIKVKGNAHNTLVSLDGTRAYLASSTTLSVVDTATQSVLQTISPIGESGVFPFTVNGAKTRGYACLGGTVGFDVADLESGKVLGRVIVANNPQSVKLDDGETKAVATIGEALKRRTHGVGLTPDEKEVWVSDQGGNAVYVFDNTVWPPKQVAKVDIKHGGHGWVGFSLDGQFAYTSSNEVIDVKERKAAAWFKDETGKLVSSSKFVEVQFDKDGKVARVGDQFGVGRVVGK